MPSIIYRFKKVILFRSLKEKIRAYQFCFNQNYGRKVLADLLTEMNFYKIAKEDGEFENGKRFTCQYILNMLNLKAEEVQDVDSLANIENIIAVEHQSTNKE